MKQSKESKEIDGLTMFKDELVRLIENGKEAIPKDVNVKRLFMNALMAVNKDYVLQKVIRKRPIEIAGIVFNFITLGLDMLEGECYIIYDEEKDETVVIRDYKGERKIAMKYSIYPIREMYARTVYEKDTYGFDDMNKFYHKHDPFSLKRGKKVGAFCTVIYESGVVQTEFVNLEEIDEVKKNSKTADSENSAWIRWEDSMFNKTATRKALKMIPLDFDNVELQTAYRETDNDIDFSEFKQRDNVEEIIVQEEPDVVEEVNEEVEEKEFVDFDEL